jgi:hypothetical protein
VRKSTARQRAWARLLAIAAVTLSPPRWAQASDKALRIGTTAPFLEHVLNLR